nr:hypothetical protein [Tanacetum cinerariifolium]
AYLFFTNCYDSKTSFKKQTSNVVEPEIHTIVEMEDNRTMAQMLQAPIEGYEDAIVVPPINANNFELKKTLINLVQSNQFTGRQDPHNHLRFFKREARIWLDKEPPRSILTWEDLVFKFINQFFPPSKTTYLQNEITNFLQKPNETFNEAWERFKDLLRQCPHHGFSELHQLDTFYDALNPNDQDAPDSAAGGNFLDKIPRECLSIIESKSKVRYSRSRVTDSRANTNAPPSSSPSNSFDLQQIAASLEDKLKIRMNRFEKFLNDMKAYFVTPTAPIKAVEEVCITCRANHSYNNCPLTRGNEFPVFHDNIQQFQTAAAVGNFIQDFVVLDFIADPRVPLILRRPFLRGRDFDSEETENFLNDDSIPIGVENSEFNMEEDILFLERLLSEEPCPISPMILNQTKSSIKEPEHSFSMGYEHFSTTLVTNEVAESSTKKLVTIPRECEVTSENGSESIEPVKDDSSVLTTFLNPLFDNDEINSDELESHVESNSVEYISNHDIAKFDNLNEFPGPLIPIHIAEEERIRREHADYINRMEMLFTINPRPYPTVNANTNIESIPSLPIPVQDNDSQREEIDIVTSTDDVLPPGVQNDDSDGEDDAVDDLRIDNSISNSEHGFFESEESDFDNPSVPLPPPEPPDEELDFEIDFGDEISVVRNTIVEFECIDARVKFDVSDDENYSSFIFVMFAKVFSFISAESEDMIFGPGISV